MQSLHGSQASEMPKFVPQPQVSGLGKMETASGFITR